MLRQDKQTVSPADTYIICHYMALLQVAHTEVEHSFMHTIALAHTPSGSVQWHTTRLAEPHKCPTHATVASLIVNSRPMNTLNASSESVMVWKFRPRRPSSCGRNVLQSDEHTDALVCPSWVHVTMTPTPHTHTSHIYRGTPSHTGAHPPSLVHIFPP